MTTTQNSIIAPGYEPISGYVLEEKIGEGGFGEVWRAIAPGGLKKAVKFVFGATDERRGSRELKSLERIKGVHHPFLLTLERFGIVDDRLVIVTELADGSLEDVLKRHLDRGSCGIPRQALLSYLHDAADALDYLHSNFQLQHLDVKPGNLLMVGGHVKVGDFGLLKDLRDTEQSMVGGLTPIYAPPELFDGRPAMNSDQYSLAVMFQELLTGTRPFDGRTIAQLATQHIHAAPNLESLPPADRVAVAKALEKNPDRRFENCKAFVDALRSPRDVEPAPVGRATGHRTALANNAVEDLPKLNADSELYRSRVTGHAFVLAIGGFGAEVLHELRSRVAELHSACPLDLHSILIDTDIKAIHAARLSSVSERVPPTTILHTPLRTAQEYRDRSASQMKSLSRRWIYNIPRSGETEGMRPLGRLAMVDHADRIDAALGETIGHLAAVCGDRVPSVYVVGSLSGGTASGMLLDLLPRVRHLLDRAGLQSSSILPLLATVTLQGNPHRPVTLLDTHAAVAEIRHFLSPGHSYPGDESIGWEGVPAARSPLQDAYLVVDGPANASNGSSAKTTVVDYLWADATTTGAVLAEARRLGNQDPGTIGKPMVRSVGVARLQCLRVLEEQLLAPSAARHLLIRWLGRPAESRQLATPLADRLRNRCGWDSQLMIRSVRQSLGENDEAITDRLAQLVSGHSTDRMTDVALVDAAIAEAWPFNEVTTTLQRRAASSIVLLHRELSTRLRDARVDLTATMQAVELLRRHCETSASELENQVDETKPNENLPAETFASTAEQIVVAENLAESRLAAMIRRLVADQLLQLANHCQMLTERVDRSIVEIAQAVQCIPGDRLEQENPWEEMPELIRARFPNVLNQLHALTADRWLLAPVRDSDASGNPRDIATDLVTQCMPIVEDLVDQHRRNNDMSGDSTSLGGTDASHPTEQTAAADSDLRRSRSHDAGGDHSQSKSDDKITTTRTRPTNGFETQTLLSGSTQRVSRDESTTVESALEMAKPALLQCGGRQRLLLVVGSELERDRLEPGISAAHEGSLTTLVITGTTPMLIHEAQGIQIDEILKRLEMVSGSNPQISRRLHARNDIDWTTGP